MRIGKALGNHPPRLGVESHITPMKIKTMSSRSKRRTIARDSLQTLEAGSYLSPNGRTVSIRAAQAYAEQHTRIYSPDDSDRLLSQPPAAASAFQTQFEVRPQTTLAAARTLFDAGQREVFCLNFASAKNPGGGFLGGSQAQEESIARASGLYPCLLKGGERYYQINRQTYGGWYTDHMIYSPRVPIFKDEEGVYLEDWVAASILTAPAVNAGVVRRQEADPEAEIERVMRRRIARVLAVARQEQHQQLVLGAWGCGVFRNDPEAIARYFREVIDTQFAGVFERIVFAVYAKEDRFIRPFYDHFSPQIIKNDEPQDKNVE